MNLAEMLAVADQATQGVELASGEYELIEPGTYEVAVTDCDGPKESDRTNPSNPAEHGQYLKIECTITGPKHAGRKLWMNNNIICFPKSTAENDVKNCQKAMAIGARERKVMLDSIGKTGIENALELVGASFAAVVAVEKGTNGYKDKNVVKSVKPLGAPSKAAPATSVPSASSATAATARAKMPWEK